MTANRDLAEVFGEMEKRISDLETKAYGKPREKAQARPYGVDFVKALISLVKKIKAKTVDELLEKLEEMAKEKGGETFFSVFPQHEPEYTGLQLNLATGRLERPLSDYEAEQGARSFLVAGMEHQKKRSLLDEEE